MSAHPSTAAGAHAHAAQARARPWYERLAAWARRNPKEAWGYAVWAAVGAVVGVPEIWAAIDSTHVPWPTISGMTGHIEYTHNWAAIIVIAIVVWAGYYALLYRPGKERRHGLRRTGHAGRLTRSPDDLRQLPWFVYVPAALAGVIVPCLLVNESFDPHDKQAFGQLLYGLIALFWILLPSLLALPKRGVQAPFATLFQTIRNLERRLHPVAVLVGAPDSPCS